MWRICTICGARTDAFVCEKDGTSTDTIRSDTVFPGRLFPGETVLENYQVGDLIGVGGMGAVYRGEQKTTHQAVAIKVLWRDLAKDPVEVKRFTREARAASLLSHPNAVRVFDFGVDPKTHAMCMIMEHLVGQKLSDALRRTPVMDPVRTVHIVTQVAKALEESHRKGIVHRDVKPDNIFLQEIAGERDFAKILDFGLAKFIAGDYERDQLTRSGYVVGSPEYMAPEQASGGVVTAAADIYSMGIVLYECLTGRLPFDATTTAEVLRMHILKGPPRLIQADNEFTRDIPFALEDVVLRCLDKDPANRPATADALRIQLLQACDRRRLNTSPNMMLPGMVVAPTSLEESGMHRAVWASTPDHGPAHGEQHGGYKPESTDKHDKPQLPHGLRSLSDDLTGVAAALVGRLEDQARREAGLAPLPKRPRTGEVAGDGRRDSHPQDPTLQNQVTVQQNALDPTMLETPKEPVLASAELAAGASRYAGHGERESTGTLSSGAPNVGVSAMPGMSPAAAAVVSGAVAPGVAREPQVVMPRSPEPGPAPYAPGAVTADAGRHAPPLLDQLDPEGSEPVAVRNARAGAAGIVPSASLARGTKSGFGAWGWTIVAVVVVASAVAAWYLTR